MNFINNFMKISKIKFLIKLKNYIFKASTKLIVLLTINKITLKVK